MRADLIRIWQHERKTVLFVTHDIEEAVQLADRVLVMSPRPATIQEVVRVDLPRPRDIDAPAYLATRDRIFQIMGLSKTGAEAARVAAQAASGHGAGAGRGRPRRGRDRGGRRASRRRCSAPTSRGRASTTLILDKAVHPRPHVGESLLCSTTRVFREIGFCEAIERAGFVRKRGALWTHFDERGTIELPFRPIPQLGIEQDCTWHVDRGRFDEALLRHAEARGSRVLEGMQVDRIELDEGGRARGVRRARGRGGARAARARRRGRDAVAGRLLGSQLRLKRPIRASTSSRCTAGSRASTAGPRRPPNGSTCTCCRARAPGRGRSRSVRP